MAGEVVPATLQLGCHAGLHRRQPEHRGDREPLGGQYAQKIKTDEDGATTLEPHPFPRCGGPQAFMLMMAQRAPESLAGTGTGAGLLSRRRGRGRGRGRRRGCPPPRRGWLEVLVPRLVVPIIISFSDGRKNSYCQS